MLETAYFLAKIGADTSENEQHFAEILPIGRRVAASCRSGTFEHPDDRGPAGYALGGFAFPIQRSSPPILANIEILIWIVSGIEN